MNAVADEAEPSVAKLSRRDAAIYRIKGCPHCGGEPLFNKTDRDYTITCPDYPNVNIFWPSGDHSRKELVFLIRDWNCDETFLLMGEDHKNVASRGVFDLRIRVR